MPLALILPRWINDTCCVCVCFLPIHSGHQVRWTYQPGSPGGRPYMIFHPPSFCSACLKFSREKDSAFLVLRWARSFRHHCKWVFFHVRTWRLLQTECIIEQETLNAFKHPVHPDNFCGMANVSSAVGTTLSTTGPVPADFRQRAPSVRNCVTR